MRAKRLPAQGLLSVRRCTECHRACTCDVQIFNIILDSLWIAALISRVVLLLASSHCGLFYNLAIFSYRVDICFQPTSPLTLGKAVFLCQCFHSPTRLLSPLDGVGCPWVGCPCPCQTKQHNLMVLAIYFAVIQAERSPLSSDTDAAPHVYIEDSRNTTNCCAILFRKETSAAFAASGNNHQRKLYPDFQQQRKS